MGAQGDLVPSNLTLRAFVWVTLLMLAQGQPPPPPPPPSLPTY